MSYIEALKNGKIPQKQSKTKRLTPYDVFMAKRRPDALTGATGTVNCSVKTRKDAERVIDALKAGKGVLTEFTDVTAVSAQRTLDFLTGAVYAINGKIVKTSSGKYLLTPPGMTIIS